MTPMTSAAKQAYKRSYFVYDIKTIDESACHDEALQTYHSTGKFSLIHFHRYRESCNDKCYVVPSPKEEEVAD